MVLSATIVNVAVPHVMGAFGIGQDEAQWMATAFIATMTASQLLNAWVVAALGPRAAFLFTLVVFVTATLISARSQSLGMMIPGPVQIGNASCRGRWGQNVSLSAGGGSIKKKTQI